MTSKVKISLSVITVVMILAGFYFCLPSPLFKSSYSTILEDHKGELLAARIAPDGQWRFPLSDTIPEHFKQALITFEDKNFYSHPGVDLFAIGDALKQNIKAGKVVRGGSTLTMQVIRLSRGAHSRTIFQKIIEFILAIRLEISSSKEEILRYYAAEAPFGGNVVGLEAASWRYFGRSPQKLSWAETATLAVLPNRPSLIFPGRNQEKLRAKRNGLLLKLKINGTIDDLTYKLAIKEDIPQKPYPLPTLALHLLHRAEKDGHKEKRIVSSVKYELQKKVDRIISRHHNRLTATGINNAAALVLEVETGRVMAYCANVTGDKDKENEYDVDLIHAPRSTGSILKPLLYGMMIHEGRLLNEALVADIPTYIGGYMPKNFYLTYDGAVSFKNAISRSLNVPAVRLLQEFGTQKFHQNLRSLGMTTLKRPASHYGLSIILGGAEGTLWDMASIYRNMAFNLNYFHSNYGKYPPYVHNPSYLNSNKSSKKKPFVQVLDAGSTWLTFEAMNDVSRPEEDASWKDFTSSYKIAWKTGTSFGNRDAWAIGCTPQYVVAVWAGNADGEGRPQLTGIAAAAPIMFDIFRLLKSPRWFMKPFNSMQQLSVCAETGYKASSICPEKDTIWAQQKGHMSPLCPYHQYIYLDQQERNRVTSNCASIASMVRKPWFVLPPAMEYYFKNKNATYRVLPPFHPDCQAMETQHKSFDILYPQRNSRILVPLELNGKPGRTVFEVTHRNSYAELFWYLDNSFLQTTKEPHKISLNPEPGLHTLTVTDDKGESKEVKFEVKQKVSARN